MRARRLTALVFMALAVAACGGGGSELPAGGNNAGGSNSGDTVAGGSGGPGGSGGSGNQVTPEASGPLAPNTIRIGDQVWERTLPMTTGQCYLFEDDGTLPTSGNAWGTLDGDDDLRFSASYHQDGSFESEVTNYADLYWGSGSRFQEDDLVVELDFDTLTISGHGTFRSVITGERAMGSFEFVCEPEDQ